MLVNLVGNAIKFTERGVVTVRVRAHSPDAPSDGLWRCCFEVADTGIGMSQAVVAQLFQPFTQADSSITRRFGGTGLGLVICQRLVGLMGGSIGVRSTLGSGSTFGFEIALASPQRPRTEAAPPAKGGPLPHFQSARVLVADDNPLNQQVAQGMLESVGCHVTLAHDGEQAVALARTQPFDLILLDLHMPVLDGLQAARQLRALPQHQTVPIVALTAAVFAEDRQRCLEAGMNGFVPKPIERKSVV